MRVDAIDPAEAVVLTFDFAPALETGETLAGTIATSVRTVLGVDPAPQDVLNGAPIFGVGDTSVLVPVKGGLVDRDYAVKVVVGTSNAAKVLALVAHLPVREEA
jgi:hypothetical protein